jgi:hypothetical protein
VQIRGTPFIAAVIMSAAAMFLIPEAVKDANRAPADATAQTATFPATGEGGGDGSGDGAGGDAEPIPTASVSVPRPVTIARAAPGTARTLRAAPVALSVNGFWSWSLIDRRTGAVAGSPNQTARSDTASMIKVWIASDFLRRSTEKNQRVAANHFQALSTMIRDSNNAVASTYHRTNGGSASITRMIKICGLTESRPVDAGSWSTTEVSARDGARLAVCVADGRAAGPQWSRWVLGEMRQVRGGGRFGIITAFAPDVAPGVAMKNGWIDRDDDDKWHVACLAVTDEWALTVLVRYPVSLGLRYGANVCRQVAVQLGSTG